MTNEEARQYLRTLESRVHNLVEPEIHQVAMMGTDKYVTIKLLNPGSFPTARVFVNNERAINFTTSVVKIPVKNGDFLILDTRGISDPIWFEVQDFSEEITTLRLGQQFWVKNNLEVVAIEVEAPVKF